MVSNKSTKKAKKPVQTTLGKAPSKSKEKDTDLSHLRKPIETNICGMKQVLSLLETATNEVKNFVMYECDIMYECKICQSIFRSLANFILHKRNYCRERINPLDYINNNDTYQENVYMFEEKAPSKEDSRSINKVIERLQKMDHIREVAKNVLTEDLSSESDSHKIKGMDDIERKSSNFNEILLEKIDTNSSCVFQTLVDSDTSTSNPSKDKSTKLEVMENHKKIENDVPVLDPEGKICGFTSNKLHQTSIFPKSQFSCIECNHRFASQKSLTNHIKCVHNPSRIVYVCPTCKATFANPWCVYRHLLKVHRMTNKQVRRMREQVHNSWIRRGEESSIQKKKPPEVNQGEADSENQWINDIEGDNDFQMCAGCGKHFERKAALHSHSQMCAKRLEVKNNIKENAKKKEEEAVEKGKVEKAANEKPLLMGASKRKGQNICSYRRKAKDTQEMEKQTINNQTGSTLGPQNTEVDLTENNDLLNGISSILTPKPSPSKSEPLSPMAGKIIHKEQHNRADLEVNMPTGNEHKITKHLENNEESILLNSVENEENILKKEVPELLEMTECLERNKSPVVQNETFIENIELVEEVSKDADIKKTVNDLSFNVNYSVNTISAGRSIIKIEENKECDNNVNSESSDAENVVLLTNMKSEAISSEEDSRSSSSLSVKSTKSMSPKLAKSSMEDNSRPRSDSFIRINASCISNIERSFSKDNFELQSIPMLEDPASPNSQETNHKARLKVLRNRKLFPNINSDSDEKLQTQSNLVSMIKKSEPVWSDNAESRDDNGDTLLHDSHDLLSNDVTFEMFCKKVSKVGKTEENNKKLEIRSPRLLRKRRKLTGSVEQSSKYTTVLPKSPDHDGDDDDVIFVGETLDLNSRFNNTALLENGFAGFSNEETSQASYSVDLSNLSYNNPLKSKHKEGPNDSSGDTFEYTDISERNVLKRKSKSQSGDKKTAVLTHEKDKFSLNLRAAPYMNETKLLCIPCGLTFKSSNLLLWHMSAHFSWFRFQCSKCSFITFNKYDCMLHARKQHNLKESNAVNFILPLPNWKTVLMSHEFRLLKDCNGLKGKHTNEKILIDESQDHCIEDNSEILESDAILFGESSESSEEVTGIVLEKENVKKRNKFGKMVIDIQETIKDFQKLPEPVELAMPADVSEVIRTLSFDENTLSPDEPLTTFDAFGDESNDDWGLPKEREYEETTKLNIITITDSDTKEIGKNETPVNIRPSRIRTKAKQNDDFVYYDNDINNVLKSAEFFKTSPQKHRTDSGLPLKTKLSGKSVPTTNKKKI